MIEIGSSIGRYHILEQLGEGGMATVYRAFDTRLDNEVALKILRVEAFGAAVLERLAKRFEREAKLMAAMSHRGIVKVTDYGEYNGAPYLVMELLPGGTLKDRMGKPFPYAEAARLAAQVALALNYAHQRQHPILHRDVKPANILINEEGDPVLTDFGIAKILEESEGNTLTGTGVGIGTPEYMAPEQGLGKEVDARADIYALGVVFFELVTGRKPFSADTPLAVLHKQIYDPLPRPRQYVPNLPKSVEQVIFKALAKKPEDRYQSMGDFAAALEGLARSADQASGSRWQGRKHDNTAEGSDREKANTPAEIEEETPETVDDLTLPAGKKVIPRVWRVAAIVAAVSMVTIGAVTWGIKALDPMAVPAQATAQLMPTQAVTIIPTDLLTQTASPVPQVTPTLTPTYVFDSNSNEKMVIRLGKGELEQIIFSPNGKYLIVGTPIGIYVYDAKTLSEFQTFISNYRVDALAISPDGRLLAGTWDGAIRLWDLETGTLSHILQENNGLISSLLFSPNGKTLVSGSGDRINIWDVEDGKLLRTITGHTEFIISFAFSPDGSRLASGSYDNTIRIWDANEGKLLRTLNAGLELYGFKVLAFSPDDRFLASGWGDRNIRIWDVKTGELKKSFIATSFLEVRGIVYSPDGRIMASRSGDYDIRVWDGETGARLSTLKGHTSNITSIAFSPDGELLASGSYDNTIKIWDAIGGVLIQTLEGHSGNVTNIAFSPDGQSLVSVSEDGTIRVWDISHIR